MIPSQASKRGRITPFSGFIADYLQWIAENMFG
jgi:hypothetical protein